MNQVSPKFLIKKMLDSGFLQATIAKEIHTSQSTVSRIYLKMLEDPKYSVMIRLNELAAS